MPKSLSSRMLLFPSGIACYLLTAALAASCYAVFVEAPFFRLSMRRSANDLDALEGFWAENQTSAIGCYVDWPCPSPWEQRDEFLARLRMLEGWLRRHAIS